MSYFREYPTIIRTLIALFCISMFYINLVIRFLNVNLSRENFVEDRLKLIFLKELEINWNSSLKFENLDFVKYKCRNNFDILSYPDSKHYLKNREKTNLSKHLVTNYTSYLENYLINRNNEYNKNNVNYKNVNKINNYNYYNFNYQNKYKKLNKQILNLYFSQNLYSITRNCRNKDFTTFISYEYYNRINKSRDSYVTIENKNSMMFSCLLIICFICTFLSDILFLELIERNITINRLKQLRLLTTFVLMLVLMILLLSALSYFELKHVIHIYERLFECVDKQWSQNFIYSIEEYNLINQNLKYSVIRLSSIFVFCFLVQLPLFNFIKYDQRVRETRFFLYYNGPSKYFQENLFFNNFKQVMKAKLNQKAFKELLFSKSNKSKLGSDDGDNDDEEGYKEGNRSEVI